MYGGKQISALSDAALDLAETDVGNCLLRAQASPDKDRYNAYFDRMSDLANAIQAEKQRRAA